MLRPLRITDARAWAQVRQINAAHLTPWEATLPGRPRPSAPALRDYRATIRSMIREERAGTALPYAVIYRGTFVGQVSVTSIVRGPVNGATIGYWIDGRVAGRGIIPTAVALVVDHCFSAGLHRLEVAIRPENASSLRVVEKLGLRCEGLRERYLHIDGAYRDHLIFAVTPEEIGGSLLEQVRSRGVSVR